MHTWDCKGCDRKKEIGTGTKRSEAKYKDLFENADDPMYTIDTQGFLRQ